MRVISEILFLETSVWARYIDGVQARSLIRNQQGHPYRSMSPELNINPLGLQISSKDWIKERARRQFLQEILPEIY